MEMKRNVLLVEDCLIAQKVAKMVFNRLDCNLDLATCGLDAISLARQNKYGLMIVDVGLPDMSGIDTIKSILSQNSEYTRSTTIVALTAHNDEEYRQNCINIGFTSYYCKPLTKDIALKMLSTAGENNDPKRT